MFPYLPFSLWIGKSDINQPHWLIGRCAPWSSNPCNTQTPIGLEQALCAPSHLLGNFSTDRPMGLQSLRGNAQHIAFYLVAVANYSAHEVCGTASGFRDHLPQQSPSAGFSDRQGLSSLL